MRLDVEFLAQALVSVPAVMTQKNLSNGSKENAHSFLVPTEVLSWAVIISLCLAKQDRIEVCCNMAEIKLLSQP